MAYGKYSAVHLPGDLVKIVDQYLEANPWGYRSRAEVVTAAVRRFLREEMENAPYFRKEIGDQEP